MAKAPTDNRKTIRMPLGGSLYQRSGPTAAELDDKDQWYINCFSTVIENPLAPGQKTYFLEKRPGLIAGSDQSANVASNTCYASTLWESLTSALSYNITIWRDSTTATTARVKGYPSATSTIGTAALGGTVTQASRITECLSGSTSAIVFWMKGSGQPPQSYFFPDGGALTQITDADFPASTIVGSFVFMNGKLFIMTSDGKIYSSDVNSLSNWTATGFLSVQALPDPGVGVARYKDKIVGLGSYSLEFFEDVGNESGSPLQPVPSLQSNVGCFVASGSAADGSYIQAFDSLYFIGKTSEVAKGLYTLEDYRPVKVSPPNIDHLLGVGGTWRIVGAGQFAKHKKCIFMACNLDSSNIDDLLVYDVELKTWYLWKISGTVDIYSIHASSPVFLMAPVLQNNAVFSADSSTFTDQSSAFTMRIQTELLDFDTEKRKRLHKLKVIGDDPGVADTTSISWSDDDYQTFSTARTVDMNNARAYLDNCGSFRRRAIKIENASNNKWRASALEFDISLMGN